MRFADMRAVYAAQPDHVKTKLAGLRARHTAPPRGDGSASPWTMQPIAARHPRTAEALLLLPNRWDIQIEHLPEREAIALIRELWQITEASPAQLEIPLQPHTLVLWDNITCSHTNPRYARAPGRVVWFFNTRNDRVIGAI
jgi:alpha-ketoglutarate-dependent taurine dioxygenase